MTSAEIDLFGVYIAPISLMIVAAWLVSFALRRIVSRSGLMQHLASGSVGVCREHHRSVVLDPDRREVVMTVTEITSKLDKSAQHGDASPSLAPESGAPARLRSRIIRFLITQAVVARGQRRTIPFLITLATVLLAGLLGWSMWGIYMGAPWTRNATVRAYVVMMAPEVAGRIVEMHVVDNKLVRKGDLLMVIDPTNYRIAVSQAEAALEQAQASVQNIDAQMTAHEAQISASQAQLDQVQAALVFAQQQAARYKWLADRDSGSVQNAQQYTSQLHQQEAAVRTALENLNLAHRQVMSLKAQRMSAEATLAQARAQLDQAQVNLERTRILSPVDGYVTNLLAQLGDFVTAGVNTISIVDANSFWVDAYFEETNLVPIRVGDATQIKLMGYSKIMGGHVDSIARAINVANALPNHQGVANVNPIFTWVRLAQRIPVRIHIDEVPPGIVLVAGLTATVEVDSRARAQPSGTRAFAQWPGQN